MRLFRSKARIHRSSRSGKIDPGLIPAASGHSGAIGQILRSGKIQTKLSVSQPGDALEQEADRTADAIMRMPAGPAEGLSASAPLIQRACDTCEEKEDKVQTKSDGHDAPAPTETPASPIRGLEGGGQPLSEETRAFFEPRFGRDFGEVRVHTDGQADAHADALHAEAFAYRNHLAFADGNYQPDTEAGRRLLAHELTHVVQQGYDAPAGRDRDSDSGMILPYRAKGSPNYGAKDSGSLVEKEFDRKAPDPYIDKITVHFTGTDIADGETVPKGEVSATYADNKATPKPSAISGIQILGGFPSQGLSDKGTDFKVVRVEGWGYNRSGVAKADRAGSDWPANKYFKASKGDQANMSFAIFFRKKQAIHFGPMDWGSLSCVHVGTLSSIRQLNYHTRAGVTKVDVIYDASALKVPCCERYAAAGYMPNPCGGQDPKKCP